MGMSDAHVEEESRRAIPRWAALLLNLMLSIALRAVGQVKAPLPRWAVFVASIVIALAGHYAVPWTYSLLTTRHGWVKGHPGRWNALGLGLVATGSGGLLWCLVLHFSRAPKTVELTYVFPS